MAMKVSLFSTGFSRWPLERTFQAASRCGYDGVDVGGFRPHAYPSDVLGGINGGASRILGYVQKYQMPIVSYAPENTGSPYSFVFRERAQRNFARLFQVCNRCRQGDRGTPCHVRNQHAGFRG